MATFDPVVVTPWYPTDANPYHGIFVRDTVQSLAPHADSVLVIHLQNLLPDDVGDPVRITTPEATILRIPVATPPGTSRQEMARRQRDALHRHAADELRGAEVVHAHVGIPAGWAVAQVIGDDTRLVVTEHATYVRKELRTVEGRATYGELLDRTAELLTVSEMEARRFRATFPAARRRVVTLGNPVRTSQLPRRTNSEHAHLDRWLYVGNFIERKGVNRLLAAFADWHDAHPDRPTHLTMVGSGELEQPLRQRAEMLGIGDAVSFPGPIAPQDLNEAFEAADVLVHLSAFETFGLTVVEAAVTGLPVVVTRCGGPEETLLEAESAGLVRFVPVSDDPADVVRAVEGLERTPSAASIDEVRRDLIDRYGFESFGGRLADVLRGGTAADPIPTEAPHVVAISLSPRAHRRMLALVPMALRAQIRLTIVSNLHGEAAACDPRVRVIDVSGGVRRSPLHWPEIILLRKAPRAALRSVQTVVGLPANVPGQIGRIARHFRRRAGSLLHRHQKLADAIHRRILHPRVYSYIDPWWTARQADARVAGELRGERVDMIVMGDIESRPLAWRLSRDIPDAPIVGMPTAEALWALRDAASRGAAATPSATH